MKGLALTLLAVALALGLAACAHPQARTQPERVPLDVPTPPERIIAPPPPEEPPAAAAQPPDPASPKPARPRPAQPKTEPPPVAPPLAQPPTPPAAASALQTTPPASQAEMKNTIIGLLKRAKSDLDSIKPASLNAEGKAQFDTARRFADQAEQALKDMNLDFALTLADKAATLARSLAGRF
jgi:outer membrane biosynthesis protein TonB